MALELTGPTSKKGDEAEEVEDQAITLEEANAYACKLALGLRSTWDWFDRKSNGIFDWQELQAVARMLKIPHTEATLKAIIMEHEVSACVYVCSLD